MQLKFTSKDGESFVFKVFERSISVGRSQDCRVCVPTASFSRRHCLIEDIDDQFFITDTSSSNGVFLNDKRIPPNVATPFSLRDKIVVGDVALKINLGQEVPEASLELGTRPNIEMNAFKPKTYYNPIAARTPRRKQKELDEEDNREKASLFDPVNILVVLLIIGGLVYYRQRAMKEIAPEAKSTAVEASK